MVVITVYPFTGLDYWTRIKFAQVPFSKVISQYDHYFVYHTLRVPSVFVLRFRGTYSQLYSSLLISWYDKFIING